MQDQQKLMAKIVAKAWADEGFKARLIANPADVLKAEGIDVPSGVTLKVVENTDKTMAVVLPAKPSNLSDVDLDAVAAAAGNRDLSVAVWYWLDRENASSSSITPIWYYLTSSGIGFAIPRFPASKT